MKLYEITKVVTSGDASQSTMSHFEPRKGAAKKFARGWNEGKRLTEKCGIKIEEHDIGGGRAGLCEWLNQKFDPTAKKKAAPTKASKKEAKKDKAKKKPKKAKKK